MSSNLYDISKLKKVENPNSNAWKNRTNTNTNTNKYSIVENTLPLVETESLPINPSKSDSNNLPKINKPFFF